MPARFGRRQKVGRVTRANGHETRRHDFRTAYRPFATANSLVTRLSGCVWQFASYKNNRPHFQLLVDKAMAAYSKLAEALIGVAQQYQDAPL